jgi:Putative Flp pilus-assembly TadE/G-like
MNPRTRLRWRADEGSISLLAVVMAFAVLAMIGLSVDGGGKVRAAERADNIASEAARAAGQAILTPQAIQGGAKVIDPSAAVAAAQQYLATAGVRGTVTVSDDRTHVTVTVTIVYRTVFLELIGVNNFTVTRHATAALVST